MSFVHLGGDDSSKPTYFEVLAADKLLPSLRAAVVYILSALSQRHAWLHRVLRYEDEVLAAAMLLVDWHSLATCDAAFAESLYGMRRRPLRRTAAAAQGSSGEQQGAGGASTSGSGSAASIDRISQGQRMLGLALQVALPYLESKLDRLYKLHAGSGVLGLALRRSSGGGAADRDGGGASTSTASGEGADFRSRLRRSCIRAFVAAYPWVHAGLQGLQFCYHLAYLLGPLEVHRPALHVLGIHMARVSAQDMEFMAKERASARQAQLARWSMQPPLPGAAASSSQPLPALLLSRGLNAVMRGALRLSYVVSDHHRNALILAVFGFKALEWWYTSAEDRLAVSKVLPPPPPPPMPQPSPSGVGLPADRSLCPVCRRPCSNPAQVATSGFVFCYPCAFGYVTDHGCCPVTGLPASLDHIRKLYEGS